MERKRVAVIKSAGLSGGGCEKYLQTIVMALPREDFSVDYYYTDDYTTEETPQRHAGTDPERETLMRDAGINLIKVTLPMREWGYPGVWKGTDLFEHFDEANYDVLLNATKGEPEWPFCELKKVPQIETIHGSDFETGTSTNATAHILLAEWQRAKWIEKGGQKERSVVIPSLVAPPQTKPSFIREQLQIPKSAFVVGMHQATRNDIFSPIPLEAFAMLQNEMEAHYILLGGAERYQDQARTLALRNVHFLPFNSSPTYISEVLSALDVYAHGRSDGEVCSACIIEALFHNLPVISAFGVNNGHVEQILGAGAVVGSSDEYARLLLKLAQDKKLRSTWSAGAKQRYESAYRYDLNRDRIISVIRAVSRGEAVGEHL